MQQLPGSTGITTIYRIRLTFQSTFPDCSKQQLVKTMWTDYFNFIKLRRGRVITPSHSEIDFSRDDIPEEICKELFEKGFVYLELTEKGKAEFYGKLEENPLPIPKKKKN